MSNTTNNGVGRRVEGEEVVRMVDSDRLEGGRISLHPHHCYISRLAGECKAVEGVDTSARSSYNNRDRGRVARVSDAQSGHVVHTSPDTFRSISHRTEPGS